MQLIVGRLSLGPAVALRWSVSGSYIVRVLAILSHATLGLSPWRRIVLDMRQGAGLKQGRPSVHFCWPPALFYLLLILGFSSRSVAVGVY